MIGKKGLTFHTYDSTKGVQYAVDAEKGETRKSAIFVSVANI